MKPRASPRRKEALDALSWVNIEIDRRLNEPPEANSFERALFSLQRRAYHKSFAPHLCEMKCIHPYFLMTKEFRTPPDGGFEWKLPHCASHALFSMSECQAQARREHEFVLFFSSGRIGDVGIAKIVLPS
jgi:hypothetical protein